VVDHIHANKNRVTDDGEGQSVEDSQPAARVDSTLVAPLLMGSHTRADRTDTKRRTRKRHMQY